MTNTPKPRPACSSPSACQFWRAFKWPWKRKYVTSSTPISAREPDAQEAGNGPGLPATQGLQALAGRAIPRWRRLDHVPGFAPDQILCLSRSQCQRISGSIVAWCKLSRTSQRSQVVLLILQLAQQGKRWRPWRICASVLVKLSHTHLHPQAVLQATTLRRSTRPRKKKKPSKWFSKPSLPGTSRSVPIWVANRIHGFTGRIKTCEPKEPLASITILRARAILMSPNPKEKVPSKPVRCGSLAAADNQAEHRALTRSPGWRLKRGCSDHHRRRLQQVGLPGSVAQEAPGRSQSGGSRSHNARSFSERTSPASPSQPNSCWARRPWTHHNETVQQESSLEGEVEQTEKHLCNSTNR